METEAVAPIDPSTERFNDLLIALERLEVQIRESPMGPDPVLDAALDRLRARFDKAVEYQRVMLEQRQALTK